MGQNSSVAANLKPEQRKQLFIEMRSSPQTVTAISKRSVKLRLRLRVEQTLRAGMGAQIKAVHQTMRCLYPSHLGINDPVGGSFQVYVFKISELSEVELIEK